MDARTRDWGKEAIPRPGADNPPRQERTGGGSGRACEPNSDDWQVRGDKNVLKLDCGDGCQSPWIQTLWPPLKSPRSAPSTTASDGPDVAGAEKPAKSKMKAARQEKGHCLREKQPSRTRSSDRHVAPARPASTASRFLSAVRPWEMRRGWVGLSDLLPLSSPGTADHEGHTRLSHGPPGWQERKRTCTWWRQTLRDNSEISRENQAAPTRPAGCQGPFNQGATFFKWQAFDNWAIDEF